MSDSGFGVLELVFDGLAIEVGEVRNGSNGLEDGVVTETGVTGTERGYHCDSFLAAKSFEGLVVDIAALKDNSTSLDIVR